jgi:hypothetical protein
MPELNNPKQFPHYIFWTPEGLIRKLLIHQGTPKPSFWLQKNQLSVVQDDRLLEWWTGELDDPKVEVFDSESEDNSDDEDDDEEDSEDDLATSTEILTAATADNNSGGGGGESEKSDISEDGKVGGKKKKNKKKKKKEKIELVDEFTKNDVRKWRGVSLSAILVNSSGDQMPVREYNPGGHVIVCLQVRVFFFFF